MHGWINLPGWPPEQKHVVGPLYGSFITSPAANKPTSTLKMKWYVDSLISQKALLLCALITLQTEK